MMRRGESFHNNVVGIGSDVSLSISVHNVVTSRDGGHPTEWKSKENEKRNKKRREKRK